MSKKINFKLLVIISILLFILFPINITFSSLELGYYYIIDYITYIILWLMPVIIFYKKGLQNKYYIFLLVFNVLIFTILGYMGEQYGLEKEKENLEKIRMIQERN